MKRSEQEAYWRRHVHGWRESGLSGVRYCEREGLARKSFYRWRKRFADEAWLPVEVESPMSGGEVRIVLADAEIIVDADSSRIALRLALDALL